MIYFQVDVDMGLRLMPDAKEEDFVGYYDGRLFRTDGQTVEAMYVNQDDSVIWKTAVAGETN